MALEDDVLDPHADVTSTRSAWGRSAGWAVAFGANGLLVAPLLLLLLMPLGLAMPGLVVDAESDLAALAAGSGLVLLPLLAAIIATGHAVLATIALTGEQSRDETTLASAWTAWTRGAGALPGGAAIMVGAVALSAVAAALAPVVSAIALVAVIASVVRRHPARRTLGLAVLVVPGVLALLVLSSALVAVASLASGNRLRDAVAAAARRSAGSHVRSVLALAALGVVGALIGVVSAPVLTATSGEGDAAGLATLVAIAGMLVVWTALSAMIMAWVGIHLGLPPQGTSRGRVSAIALLRLLPGRRMAAVLTLALLAQTPTLLGLPSAPAAQAFDGAIVVDSLVDPGAPVDGACSGEETSCDIRTAAAVATDRLQNGEWQVGIQLPAGRIDLVAPLELLTGTSLVGAPGAVLDAGERGRILELGLNGGEEGGRVTISDVTLSGGRSAGPGAAVHADAAFVELERVVLRDNVSTSGDGGAVRGPVVTVTDSTFVDNQAAAGSGGAVHASNVSWTNSTSVRNSGGPLKPDGGAVSGHQLRIQHGTFVEGGGISGSDLTVENSLFDVTGANFSCRAPGGIEGSGNVDPIGLCPGQRVSPKPYGPLGDNGGPTPTVAPLSGSPALGAGAPELCLGADQRGMPRSPAGCDAGAVDSGGTPVSSATVTLDAGPDRPVTLGDDIVLRVTVESPAGTAEGAVDVLDGTEVIARDLPLDPDGVATHRYPAGVGSHELTARFRPSDGTGEVTSQPVTRRVKVATLIEVSSVGAVRIGEPARLRLTVVPDPPVGRTLPTGFVPTGTVLVAFSDPNQGTDLEEVGVRLPLVDGVATWDVDAVPSHEIRALYDGDATSETGFTVANVLTEDVGTQTTLTAPETVAHGSPVSVTIDVSAGDVPARGTVRVRVDGTEAASGFATGDGPVTLELRDLSVGEHDLTVLFEGSGGYADSRSGVRRLTVVPATSTATLDGPTRIEPFDHLVLQSRVSGSGDAQVTLLDGDEVVATREVRLTPAGVDQSFALGRIGVGTHGYRLEIAATATTTAVSSAIHEVEVIQIGTTLSVSPQLVAPPGESRLDVTADALAAGRLVLRDTVADTVLATARLAEGGGTLTWEARRPGTIAAEVAFLPDATSPWGYGSVTLDLEVPRLAAPEPTLTWNDTPRQGDAVLTVVFPDHPEGSPLVRLDPVSGEVRMRDRQGVLATGMLENGRAELRWPRGLGPCPCDGRPLEVSDLVVDYLGGTTHAPATFVAPVVEISGWPTTTTVDVPADAGFGASIPLRADVTTPGGGKVPLSGEVVFTVNGQDLPAVAANFIVPARASYTPAPGERVVSVSARFLPSTGGLLASGSETALIRVAGEPAPRVSIDYRGLPALGQTVQVVGSVAGSGTQVADGTVITLRDQRDRIVGEGTFSGGAFSIDVTIDRTGPQRIVGRFVFGATASPGTTEVLVLPVPAKTFAIDVTQPEGAPRPEVGLPSQLLITPRLTEQEWQEAGSFTVAVRRQTAEGPLELERLVFGRGARTAFVMTAPVERGTVGYTAYTEGDDAGLGVGYGTLVLDAQGHRSFLDSTGLNSIRRGQAWDSGMRVTSVGAERPTGVVRLGFLDAESGIEEGFCHVDLEEGVAASSCSATRLLDVGDYVVEATYAGDRLHEPGSRRFSLRVSTLVTEISATFSPMPTVQPFQPWIVGQTVTAGWRVQVPGGGDPVGRVVVRDGERELCSAAVSAGSCDFTAQAPDRLGDRQVTTSFEPSGLDLAGSRTVTNVPGPLSCLTVSSRLEYADPFIADRGDPGKPTISGRTCTVPGTGRAGFVEGFDLSVDAAPVLGTAYSGRYSSSVRLTTSDGAALPGGSIGLDGIFSQRLTQNAEVVVTLRWTPRCVTVRSLFNPTVVQPGAEHDGGPVFRTQPNCDDPITPTADELENAARGELRVAAGTTVELEVRMPRQTLGNGRRVVYAVHDVRAVTRAESDQRALGSKLDGEYGVWSMTPEEDTFVRSRYDVSPMFCLATEVDSTPGGRVDVASARLGEERAWSLLVDRTPECRDENGDPGYVAGARLTVAASPDYEASAERLLGSQYYFAGWREQAGPYTSSAPREAARTAEDPGADAYRRAVLETTAPVPAPGQPVGRYRVTAEFGHVTCAAVQVRLGELPADARAEFDKAHIIYGGDCPALQNAFPREGRTYHFIRSGTTSRIRMHAPATLTATAQRVSGQNGGRTPAGADVRRASFTMAARQFVSIGGQVVSASRATLLPESYSSRESFFATETELRSELPLAVDDVTAVDLRYFDISCTGPSAWVRSSTAGLVRTTVKSTWCPKNEASTISGGAVLHLAQAPGAPEPPYPPTLTAFKRLMVHHDLGQAEPTPVAPGWRETLRLRSTLDARGIDVPLDSRGVVSVDHCAPVELYRRQIDPDGNTTGIHRLGADEMTLAGGCPDPGWGPIASRIGVGMTPRALLGQTPISGPQTAVVGMDGGTTADQFVLQAQCARLNRGHAVDADSGPDCVYAGNSRRADVYQVGSVVHLSFDRENDRRFESWSGVDGTDGDHAVVVMTGDRTVTVSYESLNVWEQAGAVLSSLGARIVSVALTAATGFVLGAFAALTAATLLLKGVGWILGQAGVEGFGVDLINASGDFASATMGVAGSLASCTADWASGGTGRAYKTSTEVNAGAGGSSFLAGKAAGKASADAAFDAGQAAFSEALRQGRSVAEATEIGNTAAQSLKDTRGEVASTVVAAAIDAGLMLSADTESYFADPAEHWSNITDIGGCLKDKQVTMQQSMGLTNP